MEFTGFTEEAFAFFATLQVNNNREFFEENRAVYENAVRKPLVALAEALAPTIQEIDPRFDIRPVRTVSRIHRDLRFRKDKTPYRNYMWVGFRYQGESRQETCGYYFDISAQASHWGCGFYNMYPETMQNFRDKLIAEPKRVLKIIHASTFAATYDVKGDAYVRQHRPPEGMQEELGALYQKKAIYAEHQAADLAELLRPDLAERLARDFLALAPFYNLLRECMIKRITEA